MGVDNFKGFYLLKIKRKRDHISAQNIASRISIRR